MRRAGDVEVSARGCTHHDASWLLNEELRGRLQVMIPINNNADAASAGGSHWSLLCYLRAAPAEAMAAAQACCARGDTATESHSHGGGHGDVAGEDAAQAAAFVHVDSCAGGNSAVVVRALPAARHLVGAPPISHNPQTQRLQLRWLTEHRQPRPSNLAPCLQGRACSREQALNTLRRCNLVCPTLNMARVGGSAETAADVE